jgi:hypothetical protein
MEDTIIEAVLGSGNATMCKPPFWYSLHCPTNGLISGGDPSKYVDHIL